LWERFSYYGMRGFLILYMVKGLGFDDKHAGSVYGNYVGSVWLMADRRRDRRRRWLGQYKSVLYGGIIIALGSFSRWRSTPCRSFTPGLTLIVLGTGLLKPNALDTRGGLVEPGDQRRDAGSRSSIWGSTSAP